MGLANMFFTWRITSDVYSADFCPNLCVDVLHLCLIGLATCIMPTSELQENLSFSNYVRLVIYVKCIYAEMT